MLTDKVAIICGAGSGIGAAVATLFAREGARVVVADKDEQAGKRTASDITDRDQQAEFVACNCAERLDILNLVASTIETFGQIDIVIFVASVCDDAPFLELHEHTLERAISTNVKAAILIAQAASRQMIQQIEDGGTPGVIVNVAPLGNVYGAADHAAHTIAIGALTEATKAASRALAPHGIRVNQVAHGKVRGASLLPDRGDAEGNARQIERIPLHRYGKAEEVASIVEFLASERSAYLTGEVIHADGGRLEPQLTLPQPPE